MDSNGPEGVRAGDAVPAPTNGPALHPDRPTDLGWDPAWERVAASRIAAGLVPGRVTSEHRGAWDVAGIPTGTGTAPGSVVRAVVSGHFRFESTRIDDSSRGEAMPAVGDWVLVEPRPLERAATITGVLPRRTRFTRRGAGRGASAQVVAANVDDVLIVSSLNCELNPRRLERYLALTWESGARPIVVLTKADLVADPAPAIESVERVSLGVPVHAVSATAGTGLGDLDSFLLRGRTVALLGSSGVGKSTLANALLGEDALAVGEIRADDDRGRHTTSGARLVQLPGGALLIDTPGMRELGLWDANEGLTATFADVEELVGGCRFSDCAHDSEPGCAVRTALEQGRLDRARWASYLKLVGEQTRVAAERDAATRRAERRRFVVLSRAAAADVAAKRYRTGR